MRVRLFSRRAARRALLGGALVAAAASCSEPKPTDPPSDNTSQLGTGRQAVAPQQQSFDAAAGCELSERGIAPSCPAYKAFEHILRSGRGKHDTFLVRQLDSKEVPKRWLAARGLERYGRPYRRSSVLSKRLLTLAQSEKSDLVLRPLSRAVGKIDGNATSTTNKLRALMTGNNRAALREGIASSLLLSNRDDDTYEFILSKLDTLPPNVAKAALGSLWVATPPKSFARTCGVWLDHLKRETHLAPDAAYFLASANGAASCDAHFEVVLGHLKTRAHEGRLKSARMASALRAMHGHLRASPEQKARCVSMAKDILALRKSDPKRNSRAVELELDTFVRLAH